MKNNLDNFLDKKNTNFFTEEQQKIIDYSQTNNIVVDAIPGSGKTTTIIGIVKNNMDKRILILTYNTRLMENTRVKINKIRQRNQQNYWEIRTFHSFAASYWAMSCRDDGELQKIFDHDGNTVKNIDFDLIIIDEAQDLTPLLWKLTQAILSNNINNKKCQYVFFGDKNQTIYQHNGSTPYYFLNVDKLINNNIEWKHLSLTNSFRVKKSVWDFFKINDLSEFNGTSYADKTGNLEIHVTDDDFIDYTCNIIEEKISSYGIENVFVLSPIVNNSHSDISLIKIANEINLRGYETFYPKPNSVGISENQEKNKLVFASVHQSKGREKKCVILYNFNKITEDIFNENTHELARNLYYVAMTRASEDLIVINVKTKEYGQVFPSFIEVNNFYDKAYFHSVWNKNTMRNLNSKNNIEFSRDYRVTDLVKKISYKTKNDLSKVISKLWLSYPEKIINIKDNIEIKDKQQSYNVSTINSIYSKILYSLHFEKGQISEKINYFIKKFSSKDYEFKNKINKQLKIASTLSDKEYCLTMAMIFDALLSHSLIGINSIPIDERKWINNENYNLILDRLTNIQNEGSKLWYDINYSDIEGIVDLIDYESEIMYWIKFNDRLSDNDIYELVINVALLYLEAQEDKKMNNLLENFRFVLFNIRNNSKLEIEINDTNELKKIVSNAIDNIDNNIPDIDVHYSKVELSQINKILIDYETVKLGIREAHGLKSKDKFVFFDFETSSLTGYVCQIGMVIVENNKISSSVDQLINPLVPIDYAATLQHHISDEMVENAPSFSKYWDNIKHYFNGEYLLIAHNIAFDINVLKRELIRSNISLSDDLYYFCSRHGLKKYNEKYKKIERLNFIAYDLGIDFQHHNAYHDAKTIFDIFSHLEKNFKNVIQKSIDNGYRGHKFKIKKN
ncbi:exonuclease domain-containing protein [Mycoplasma sp. CSL7475-4]|uniref:exonuclease domain-containing protein n=1 Tax=Mycoplasma sp. CSL7475-4 TaxID=2973942 RepID=UPI00216B5C31|nr:exonuclease domain-containing protein [Mycoplasma sp. CSL7475-4]MCS4536786.1 exonuclease domain-containing protein [Mycoplasma sp. CSL7475-4]